MHTKVCAHQRSHLDAENVGDFFGDEPKAVVLVV